MNEKQYKEQEKLTAKLKKAMAEQAKKEENMQSISCKDGSVIMTDKPANKLHRKYIEML